MSESGGRGPERLAKTGSRASRRLLRLPLTVPPAEREARADTRDRIVRKHGGWTAAALGEFSRFLRGRAVEEGRRQA